MVSRDDDTQPGITWDTPLVVLYVEKFMRGCIRQAGRRDGRGEYR